MVKRSKSSAASRKSSLLEQVEKYLNHESGQRIRDARVMKGATLEQLSAELGISPAQLNSIETGKTVVKVTHIVIVSQALEVDFAYFFEGLGLGAIANPIQYASGREYGQRMQQAGEIARSIAQIPNETTRRMIRTLLEHLAQVLGGGQTEEADAQPIDP